MAADEMCFLFDADRPEVFGDCCDQLGTTPKPLWFFVLVNLPIELLLVATGQKEGSSISERQDNSQFAVFLGAGALAFVSIAVKLMLLAKEGDPVCSDWWRCYQAGVFLFCNSSALTACLALWFRIECKRYFYLLFQLVLSCLANILADSSPFDWANIDKQVHIERMIFGFRSALTFHIETGKLDTRSLDTIPQVGRAMMVMGKQGTNKGREHWLSLFLLAVSGGVTHVAFSLVVYGPLWILLILVVFVSHAWRLTCDKRYSIAVGVVAPPFALTYIVWYALHSTCLGLINLVAMAAIATVMVASVVVFAALVLAEAVLLAALILAGAAVLAALSLAGAAVLGTLWDVFFLIKYLCLEPIRALAQLCRKDEPMSTPAGSLSSEVSERSRRIAPPCLSVSERSWRSAPRSLSSESLDHILGDRRSLKHIRVPYMSAASVASRASRRERAGIAASDAAEPPTHAAEPKLPIDLALVVNELKKVVLFDSVGEVIIWGSVVLLIMYSVCANLSILVYSGASVLQALLTEFNARDTRRFINCMVNNFDLPDSNDIPELVLTIIDIAFAFTGVVALCLRSLVVLRYFVCDR